jgi:ribosomal protein S20
VESVADDSWVNPRYFEKRDMRPLFVEELATHPDYQGQGIGSYMMEQLEHLARVRGCTHLVLEVAENNEAALAWYRKRNFYKLDAAIFLARRIESPPELLPPRGLTPRPKSEASPRKKSKRMPRSIAVVSIDGPPPAPAKAEDDDERAAPHALHATKKSSKSATKTAPRKPAKKAPAKSTKKVTKVAKVAKSTAPKPAASKDVVHANGASKDGTSSS